MKKIIITMIILFGIILVPSFSAEKVIIGVYDDYPLLFEDENGEADGLLIDLIKYIFDKENIEYGFKYGSWDDMLKWVESGEIDIVVDIIENDRRSKIYDFSNESLISSWGILVRNKHVDINNIIDLEGIKIGYLISDYYAVEKGGLLEKIVKFNIDAEITGFYNYNDYLRKIENGELDAGLLNHLTKNYIYDYKNIEETDIIFAPGEIRIAVKKNQNSEILKTFDKHISKLKKDKESYLYKRHSYWFDKLESSAVYTFFRKYSNNILIVIFVVLFVIGYSRLQVAIKSKELKNVNKKLEDNIMTIKNFNKDLISSNNELEASYQDNDRLIKKYDKLVSFLSININYLNDNSDQFLKEILNTAMELIEEADFGNVYKYDENDNKMVVLNTVNQKMFKIEGVYFDDINFFEKDIVVVDDFLNLIENNLKDKAKIERFKGRIKPASKTLLSVLRTKEKVEGGVVLNINKESNKEFSKESLIIMNVFNNIADSYFTNRRLFFEKGEFQKELIFSIVEMLEIHDEYTKGHSESVAKLSKALALKVGLGETKADELYWAGLVHDIGKILIPNEIINKVGKLTNEEFDIMKKHPTYGYQALKKSKATEDISKYILHHHEKINGTGYPYGLKGEEIPFESRIIAVVDAFDAMTSERSYREILDIDKALLEIERNLGSQFDSKIGREFIKMIKNDEGMVL